MSDALPQEVSMYFDTWELRTAIVLQYYWQRNMHVFVSRRACGEFIASSGLLQRAISP